MPKLTLRGTALEYVEQGDGDPIVLVHGSASDYRSWQVQLDAFAKRYWAIAYSRRYHWPNEPIAAQSDYSMEEHVRDLEALLRVIGPAPAAARSPAVFRRVLDRLEELVPRAERITIPAASHIMHEDNPDAFNAAVLSFLAERGGQISKSPFK